MDEVDLISYRCRFCYQSYTSLWALNRHVRRDHGQAAEKSIPLKGWLARLVRKLFKKKGS